MADLSNMSIEHESTVGQQARDVNPQPNQETVVSKPNFAGRLVEIKKSAQTHMQKVNQLFNPETPREEPQKPFVPEDVLSQLEALGKDETLSPGDFLSQSRQILQASAE